jgi:glycosyltransferase involved in cell wall biosynthesis
VRIQYCYIAYATQGNKVHIDSFINACVSLGQEIVDGGITLPPWTGEKSEWSLGRKLAAKLIWLRQNVSHLNRLFRLARETHPDVLLFRSTHQMFLATFWLSFWYPVVLEVNATKSMEAPSGSNELSDFLDRLLFWRAKGCFVVSSIVKHYLVKKSLMPPEKIVVIENGVDTEVFRGGLPRNGARKTLDLEGRFIAGFVGSFQAYHGIENIIALAEAIKHEGHEIVFLIVGDGKEKKQYQEMVKAKGLEECVIFAGFVPHERIHEYMAAMDVALAPHRRDSFAGSGGFHGSPLKLFEYMAMAKPIIAAPLGQINELIVDGESGLLVYSEDTLALKEALLKLYRDKEYRERLGANARKRVEEKYTWRANAQKVHDLCRQCMDR